MKFAAWMMYGSAALHLCAPFVMGFSGGPLLLALVGAVWAVLAWLLITRGWRALAYGCFVLALGGMCMALSQPFGSPKWLAYGFAGFDAAAALGLMGALWGRKETNAAV